MKYILFFIAIVALILFGLQIKPRVNKPPDLSQVRFVSESEFEQIRGHNAAAKQFGHKEILIDTSNIRVNKYLVSTSSLENKDEYVVEESAYARGYHKALDFIEKQNMKECPFP